jgi:hypothetical protein
MSTSQLLVQKLLKAHTAPPETAAESTSANKKFNRKRKNAGSSRNDRVASEDDIIKWHTKLLLDTDRIMATSVDRTKKSSKSNAAAFQKLAQRREQKFDDKLVIQSKVAIETYGAARTSTSALSKPSIVKIPTFNKEQYERDRKEKKHMKLAKALEKLNTINKHTTKKRKKTIFG